MMFTDYFFPELGGIQDSVATLGRALGRRGHSVEILAPRYGRRDYSRVNASQNECELGPQVRVRRRQSLPFPSSTQQSRAALMAPLGWVGLGLRARPDLLHVHSFFGLGLEAVLGSFCLRLPLIGTNHTTVEGFAGHIPVNARLASSYVAWFYNRCDLVTTPSRALAGELMSAGLRPACRIVSNPIDTDLFRPAGSGERALLRRKFGLRRPTVIYAGRLGAEKNIAVLLRAMALLPEDAAELVIAGHGSEQTALERLASELGIGSRLRFLGTLVQSELALLLRASDLFAIMSTSETQSMVLLQAMASGLPAVVAASRALPELVDDTTGRLVTPGDHAALARALEALLAATECRRSLGRAARRRAELHGIDATADAWEAIYASVMERSFPA